MHCSDNMAKAWFHQLREYFIFKTIFWPIRSKKKNYKAYLYIFISSASYTGDIDVFDIMNMRSRLIEVIFRISLFFVIFAQGYGNSKLIYRFFFLFSPTVNHKFVKFRLEKVNNIKVQYMLQNHNWICLLIIVLNNKCKMNVLNCNRGYCNISLTYYLFYKMAVVTLEIGQYLKSSVTVVKVINFLGILQDCRVPN